MTGVLVYRRVRLLLVLLVLATAMLAGQLTRAGRAFADSCDREDTQLEECIVDEGSAAPGSAVVGVTAVSPIGPALRGRLSIAPDRRFYFVGDPIRLCFSVPGPGVIRLTDIVPDGRVNVVAEWYMSGQNDCFYGYITPPGGRECIRLSYFGGFRAYHVNTCFFVNW